MVEGIRQYTAHDVEDIASPAAPLELVDGEVVSGMWSGDTHGILATELGFLLREFLREQDIDAYLTIEGTGYMLSQNPDTVRAPDIGVVFKSRAGKPSGKAFTVAPDLAVEIVSPSDKAIDVDDKVQRYLKAGTRLVWVLYPDTRTVYEFKPAGAGRVLSADDAFDGGELLPGLRIPIADLFAILDE